jgi:hypothetical protein
MNKPRSRKRTPSGREERERRREVRLSSTNLVSYCSLRGAKVYSVLGVAETLDISLTGMRVMVKESLVLGQTLEFGLKLGDSLHYIKGQLVRGSMRDEESFEFGINFIGVTPLIREAIKQYLSWTGHFKGSPGRGGMMGQFEGHQLVDLVQMLGIGRKTGVLRVMTDYSDAFFGMLLFSDGKIVAASTSHGLKAQEAAFELVTARHGSFEFRPDLPAGMSNEMLLGVETLLLEALRRRDEDIATAPPGTLTSSATLPALTDSQTTALSDSKPPSDDTSTNQSLADTTHDDPYDRAGN